LELEFGRGRARMHETNERDRPMEAVTPAPPAEPKRGWIRRLFAVFGVVTTPEARWHVRIRPRFFAWLLGGLVFLIEACSGWPPGRRARRSAAPAT